MKVISAIVCSLILVLAPFAPATAAPACAKPAMVCAGACCPACCAVPVASHSQPALILTAPFNFQMSLPVSSLVAWTLPADQAASVSFASLTPELFPGTPLYERNCVLLL